MELKPSGKYRSHPAPPRFLSTVEGKYRASSFPVWTEATCGSTALLASPYLTTLARLVTPSNRTTRPITGGIKHPPEMRAAFKPRGWESGQAEAGCQQTHTRRVAQAAQTAGEIKHLGTSVWQVWDTKTSVKSKQMLATTDGMLRCVIKTQLSGKNLPSVKCRSRG